MLTYIKEFADKSSAELAKWLIVVSKLLGDMYLINDLSVDWVWPVILVNAGLTYSTGPQPDVITANWLKNKRELITMWTYKLV